ncbi:MAG: hypothetical protein GQ572_11215 [Gammaproteobacteria bacterium]|nr:hypothetical protein [Gammaproteobacteria bacterium]
MPNKACPINLVSLKTSFYIYLYTVN